MDWALEDTIFFVIVKTDSLNSLTQLNYLLTTTERILYLCWKI